MEEDIQRTPQRKQTAPEERAKERLLEAVEEAEGRQQFEAAHNSELLKALAVVHSFIKRKGRVCYGGTAMNAILPPAKQFYDPETDLPDYDFFTPEMEEDVKDIVKDLEAAGFKDVYHRVGIHDGTKKILVNFVPIADITDISKGLYDILWRRAYIRGGIRYTDPDILRMMMYLELSRPKGQVERWPKVYERLQLVNSAFPPKRRATMRGGRNRSRPVPDEIRRGILDFCIEKQRTLFSGPLDSFYRAVISRGLKAFPIDDHSGPVGILSPNLREDAQELQAALGGPANTQLFFHGAKGELVPNYMEIRNHGIPVAILLQETACHSYLSFSTPDGRSISIASLDSLITTLYSIAIFTHRAQTLLAPLTQRLPAFIKLAEQNRRSKRPRIPAFPLSCHGYQKGFSTLMREKVERILKEKEKKKAGSASRKSLPSSAKTGTTSKTRKRAKK